MADYRGSLPDRGAAHSLRFDRCARGFTLMTDDRSGMLCRTYAFDKIEDVAEWLVSEYAPLPDSNGPEAGA